MGLAANDLFNNVSARAQTERDRRKIAKLGIKSPDTSKMYPIRRGRAVFYYHTREKYERALAEFKEIDRIQADKLKRIEMMK